MGLVGQVILCLCNCSSCVLYGGCACGSVAICLAVRSYATAVY